MPDMCVWRLFVGVYAYVCAFLLFVYVRARASTPSIFNPFYLKIKREAGD